MTYISWFTALIKNIQSLHLGQFLSNYKGFILGIHLHLVKTNRNQWTVSDDDLYFMVDCFWKKFQFLLLGQFLSNYRGLKLHTWHMLTSVEDQQKALNHIWCWPIFHGSLHLEKSVHVLPLGQFLRTELQGIEASYLAYTYIWGRPTETSETYLMMTYISWSSEFTLYLQPYYIDLHHASDISLVWHLWVTSLYV